MDSTAIPQKLATQTASRPLKNGHLVDKTLNRFNRIFVSVFVLSNWGKTIKVFSELQPCCLCDRS